MKKKERRWMDRALAAFAAVSFSVFLWAVTVLANGGLTAEEQRWHETIMFISFLILAVSLLSLAIAYLSASDNGR